MFFWPTASPIATDAITKASQPKTAVFQWLALQRPIRAAMLFDLRSGDIGFPFAGSWVLDRNLPAEAFRGYGAGWCLGVRVTALRFGLRPRGCRSRQPRR